jgi:L-lactate dehydrogenase (cytochrome)
MELDPTARRLRRAVTVDDLRALARRRVPAGVFDYFDGGADDERSLRRNVEAFSTIEFVPDVLTDVSSIDTTTELFGQRLSMPLMLAPTGFSRLAHSQGELAVARAAARAGVPYALSTLGTRSIEEVADVCDGPKWFQVYVWKDRGLVREMIARAATAGYDGLLLTVDTPVPGRRERDVRRGLTIPPAIGPGMIVDGILHPAWTVDFLSHEPILFANVANRETDRQQPVELARHVIEQFDLRVTWDDVDLVRSAWDGPILLKGVLNVDDALRAVSVGLQGVVLSNHGGRQLDDSPAPIRLVEPVAQAFQGKATIVVDGGVRRGSDIVKAIALGADACAVGRPYLYALAVAGERGVDHVLRFFREGVERTMALTGRASIGEIGRDLVRWM